MYTQRKLGPKKQNLEH